MTTDKVNILLNWAEYPMPQVIAARFYLDGMREDKFQQLMAGQKHRPQHITMAVQNYLRDFETGFRKVSGGLKDLAKALPVR